MKVLHLNAGNETGGGMHHILLLLNEFSRDEVILGVFEEGELANRARAIGIKTEVFKQGSRKDFSIVKKVVGFIQEEKIDIIHTHGARANLYGTFIAKKAKCKWVSTIHSNPDDDFLGKGIKGIVFTAINKWSIKKAHHLFAISDRFKEMVEGYGIPSEKITTILNGIDFKVTPKSNYTRADLQVTEEDFIIIMIARLEKVKDHMVALQALKGVVEKNANIKLLLVGEGSERSALEKEVRDLLISSEVIFMGHREDVTEILPLADLCLLTSKSESFPLVLLEAARAGIPAITTNVGGVGKMIPATELGWITAVGDVPGICKAIEEAIHDKEDASLAQKGKRFSDHCEGNFSILNQANDIYRAYKKMLS